MPNEPDNKMDDLLKAYAQKRRADAGGPLEMHPATRRLLQAEAAKLRPKAEEKRDSWFSALLAHGPRLAFGVAVVAVLGAVVWMAVPSRDSSEARMFAKQEAPVERLDLAKEQSKRDLGEARDEDGLALTSKLKQETSVDQRMEAASSFPEKPAESRAMPPAPSLPQPSSPPRLAKDLANGNAAPRARELDAAQLPELSAAVPDAQTGTRMRRIAAPAPAAPPSATASLADAAPGYLDLGNFSNSAPAPVSLAVNLAQAPAVAGGAVRTQAQTSLAAAADARTQNSPGVDRTAQVNRYYEAAQQPATQTRAQEQAVTLADAESRLRPQLNAPAQNQAGKNVAEPAPVGQANKSLNYSAPPPAIQAPGTGLAINADRYGQNLGGPAAVPQDEKKAATLRSNSTANEVFNYANARGTAATPVLANFGLEQRGDRIRVRDGDGSIYEGMVTPPADAVSGQTLQRAEGVNRNLDVLNGSGATKPPLHDAATGGVVSFRVTGMNQTYQLPVTLEGTFVTGTAPVAALAANDTTTRTVQRVLGRATIGTTNELRIDAVRTAK